MLSVFAGGLVAVAANPGAAAAVAPPAALGGPSPGEYRIDSDTTTTTGSGAFAVVRRQRTDGATGRLTVDLTGGGSTTTQNFAGDGPNRFCVGKLTAAPRLPPQAAVCRDAPVVARPGSVETKASCDGFVVTDRFTRLDDKTWSRVFTSNPSSGPAPGRSAGGGTPESDAAMAGITAQLEQKTRSADPEEAESARRDLAMLKKIKPMAPGGQVIVESKETWHRVAESCKGS